MYITSGEFESLSGVTIADPLFTRLEFQARMQVDDVTFGRFKTQTVYPEELKMLMVEMITLTNDTGDTDAVVASRSSSQGGVSQSETYAVSDTTKTVSEKSEDLIRQYMANVEVDGIPVLYRGCEC